MHSRIHALQAPAAKGSSVRENNHRCRAHGVRHDLERRRASSERLHAGHRASARGTQFGISAGHLDTAEQSARNSRLPRRLHLVRRRLGGQPRLGLCRVPLLRLRRSSRAGPAVWCQLGIGRGCLYDRRLLGPLLPRTAVVCPRELLAASPTAAASPSAASTPSSAALAAASAAPDSSGSAPARQSPAAVATAAAITAAANAAAEAGRTRKRWSTAEQWGSSAAT